MWIEITRATRIGGSAAALGAKIDAPEDDARVLLQMGKAILCEAPAAEEPAPVVEKPKTVRKKRGHRKSNA